MSDLRFVIDFTAMKSTRDAKQVEIFTDGSALGNPGPWLWRYLYYRGHEKTFSEGYTPTTNNRMEPMAATSRLKRC